MNRGRNLSVEEAVRASTSLDEGYSMRHVARVLGRSHSTLSRMVRRFNETGSHLRRPGQGRKRCTTPIDERFLRQSALRNRRTTSTILQNELVAARNVHVSSRTIRRRLNEAGLTSRKPAKKPLLTREHKIQRLRFARNHQNWTINDWKTVLFSDETRISLKSPDGRERVWRRSGERFASCNISPRVPFGGGSVMFWGGICFDGRTEFVPIRVRSMNADYYLENIVVAHVMPFAPFLEPNFLFMQDNARPHVARQVIRYLNDVEIPFMEWPPNTPDMNPIEHLWDYIKKNIRRRTHPPVNHNQLVDAAIQEWENTPQEVIQNLISSMPRRIDAVIKNRGGHTRY